MAPPVRPKPLVLRAVSRMAIGGVQRGILATLARADRGRFDFHVLCTKKEGHWASQVRDLGIPLSLQKTLPPWDPYQIARLARRLRRIRPDLAHIHMAPMVIPVASACRLAGVRRIVIQWHSDYERFWDEQQNALLRAWERWLTRRAGAVLAVSSSAARANAARMGVPPEAVRVIPNGIELERWRDTAPVDPRPAWGLDPRTPLVVQVSRYLDTKRIEDFIEAAGRVSARWPESSAGHERPAPAFVVIGGGADDYRRRYEAKIDEVRRAVPGVRVWLEGNRDDLPALLPCAQVGVLTSENEGFGQVILEYIAAGLPVAATDIPSIAEITRQGQAALLVPPRDPDRMARSIIRLLLEPSLRESLSAAGRRILPEYDWAKTAALYESVYAELLPNA